MLNLFRKIKITKCNVGSHGDHWGAYFGFDNKSRFPQKIINIMEKTAKRNEVISQNSGCYSRSMGKPILDVKVLCQAQNDLIASGFPLLKSSKVLDFKSGHVVEWSHVKGIEGQICGAGPLGNAVSFFATDYLEKAKDYKNQEDLQISLTGFAYGVDMAPELSEEFSSDFVTYMPKNGQSSIDVYDFIGRMISVELYEDEYVSGYVVDVELISNEDPFVLPMFVHRDNLRTDLAPNGRISGCFWMQGRIVD